MNNFTTSASTANSNGDQPSIPKHLESLVTTMFQSIFPPLNPQTTPLNSIKRVFLLNREPPADPSNNAYTVTLRHYAISSKVTGLPKPLRRLNQAAGNDKSDARGNGLPNLGRLEDVSEYLLGGETGDGNYTSASESEPETDAEVEVLARATKKVLNKSQKEKFLAARENGTNKGSGRPDVEKRAIKLTELGPRMRLRLIKVEEGLCGGRIMWHDHVEKSKVEEKELDAKWEQRRKEKEERRRVQKENVSRKRKAKGENGAEGEEGDDENMEYDVDDDEYWDDDIDGEDEGEAGEEDEQMENEDVG
jgi:ribosome biogenesis protein SSF1/2